MIKKHNELIQKNELIVITWSFRQLDPIKISSIQNMSIQLNQLGGD